MKNLFAKMNMEPKDALYTTSSTTSVNLAARGFGITFLPEGGIRHTAHVEQLAFFTVDNPPFSVPLLLLYKKNSIISPHAKDFIDMVRSITGIWRKRRFRHKNLLFLCAFCFYI